jgi:hypothetical protein
MMAVIPLKTTDNLLLVECAYFHSMSYGVSSDSKQTVKKVFTSQKKTLKLMACKEKSLL